MPSNLSLPRSPLIGREREIAILQQLLLQEQIGLLTLTGPGGIGKTRLALQAAAGLLDQFVDGVYFIALAPIRESDQVGAAIAQTLGVRATPGQALQASLQAYLRDKQLLLVLDNFEQVLAAAPLVSALLTACRRLKVLATCRAPLHLYGEQEFPVSPLALPDARQLATIADDPAKSQVAFAAIHLFCQRARAVVPDFALTTSNAADVARICIGLDGMPLAIELAAARVKLFSARDLLARLDQCLVLLTGGPQDAPLRQRTLRDEIAWSYNLLAPGEQMLFRRLAIFVGGFTLEAGHAVANADHDLGVDFLDGLTTLLDQNLVRYWDLPGGKSRFGLLETIREYGLEQLAASGEAETIRRHHAEFFLTFAETTAPMLRKEQAQGLARLLMEHANLRAVLAWSLADALATTLALRLAIALQDFWLLTGNWREGGQQLEAALARTTAADRTIARADALIGVSFLMMMLGDSATAYVRLEEGLAIATEREAKRLMIDALTGLGFVANGQQDHARAAARHREALAIGREIGDQYAIGSSLCFLASLAREKQDYSNAQTLYEESLSLFRTIGAEWDAADVLSFLGQLARVQTDYGRAWAFYRDSLARWRVLGTLQWKGVVECLAGLAHICGVQQQWAEAAHLFGAADTLQQALSPASPSAVGDELTTLRTQLGEAAFTAAWAAGCTLSTEQAVDDALALPAYLIAPAPPVRGKPVVPAVASYLAGLTAREVEVLRWLAEGLTYAQIADKLIVSRRTVNGHVTSIYSKLGVNGRAAATRVAMEQRLV